MNKHDRFVLQEVDNLLYMTNAAISAKVFVKQEMLTEEDATQINKNIGIALKRLREVTNEKC